MRLSLQALVGNIIAIVYPFLDGLLYFAKTVTFAEQVNLQP
jgi:hypothetical protein